MIKEKLKTFFIMFVLGLTLGPGVFLSKKNDEKRHPLIHRPLQPKGVFVSLLYLAFMFLVPLTWGYLLSLHLLGVGALSFFSKNPVALTTPQRYPQGKELLWNNLWGIIIMLLPPTFFVSYLSALENFSKNSLQAPSEVYGSTLLVTLGSLPVIMALSWITYKVRFRVGVRILFIYYLTLVLSVFAMGIWEEAFQYLLGKFQVSRSQPILFSYQTEVASRRIIQWGLTVLTFILFFLSILSEFKTKIKLRRLFKIIAFTFFAFGNMLIWTGESVYLLEGIRKVTWGSLNFKIYKKVSQLEVIKYPHYYKTPGILHNLAELEYQTGNHKKAEAYFREILKEYKGTAYHAELIHNIENILATWKSSSQGEGSKESPLFARDIRLDVPVVQYANYLTLDWYGALSAIGHHLKGLPDLELKEKLLGIFSKENHSLPSIETLPILVPVLERLSIPATTAFLNDTALVKGLQNNAVPLIYFNHTWVPIIGYDAFRDGFYYYDYASNYNVMLRLKSKESIFSKSGSEKENKILHRNKLKHQRFISRSKLAAHLLNIGGVGILVGDTTLISQEESDAAYLIELGDHYYQYQNNFKRAALAYQKSLELNENWVVKERMAFLLKHYQNKTQAKGKISSLFTGSEYASLKAIFSLDTSLLDTLKQRVFSGQAGLAILQQWPTPNLYYQKDKVDTLHLVYSHLNKSEPFNLEYIDSLASLEYKRKNYSESRKHYQKLMHSSPYGDEVAALNVAWSYLIENNLAAIKKWFPDVSKTYYPAKYFTLAAALDLHNGKYEKALQKLKRSLKNDKTLYLTHDLLVQYYNHKGDEENKIKHERWSKRCRGII